MTDTDFGLLEFTENDFSFLSNMSKRILYKHRGFEEFNPKNVHYIYTGRGPSQDSFHIGHIPALSLCLELQKYFGEEKIEFMIADDEKLFRDTIEMKKMEENVKSTLQQLDKLGFKDTNTNFRINSNGINKKDYEFMIQILKKVSINTLNSIFGEKKNVGEYFYPLLQILPSLSKTKTCIVIAGIDQDPFFRLARDIARKLGYNLPIIIYTKSIPGLDGSDKMSTSNPESLPIFITDSKQIVEQKIKKIKKVGAGSLDELFEKGADLNNDIPFQLIEIFESSEEKIGLIKKAYTIGLTEENDIRRLSSCIPAKGLCKREKTMLTSYGIREYLGNLINEYLMYVK